MKFLQDYKEKDQAEAFKKYGAFFAFNKEQFFEKRVEGVTYVNVGAGLIIPKGNVDSLLKELDDIHAKGIKQDIEENGIQSIIKRELGNYECFYTGDIQPAVEALEDYNITLEEIKKVFYKKE